MLPRLALTLCSLSLALSAQQFQISGTVRDAHGVVPGANITLLSPSGSKSQAQSSNTGEYKFEGLISGSYQLSVARAGFETATRSIVLRSESATMDVTLGLGGIATSVDVTDVAEKATGSRMEIADREIPQMVSVVTQRTIQEQGINDLASALENISGVTTQKQYGVYEWYTVGGYAQQSGYDTLLVDGMTLTGNRSNTQLNNVEQVEVIKGPAAVLYGGTGSAQGGMVNVIRKKPQAVPSQDIVYRLGRWGLQDVGAGTAGTIFGLNRLLYRVDTGYSHQDGFRQTGANRFNITPSLTWLINNRMRVTVSEGFTRDRYTLDGGIPVGLLNIKDFPLDRKLNPTGDFQLSRDWQNQIVFQANLTNRIWLRNSFFKRRNTDQYLDAETLAYVPASNTITRAALYYQHNRRPVQDVTDIGGVFNFLGMKHTVMVSYEYSDQFNYSNRTGTTAGSSVAPPVTTLRVVDFLNPNFVDPFQYPSSFPRSRVDYSAMSINAVSFQDQIRVNKRLAFNFSGRYTDFKRRTHNDNWLNDVFVSTGPEAGARHQTPFNYRGGVVYQLFQGYNVYFSSATTFQPVNTIPADGKELDPTTTRTFALGQKWEPLHGRLKINIEASKKLDQNLLLPLGGNLFDQGGRGSSKALDFDLEGDLGWGVRAVAAYGYADPRYDQFKTSAGVVLDGLRRQYSQRHLAKIWLTKQFKLSEDSAITASLGMRYISPVVLNTLNTAFIPPFTKFTAAAGYRRGKYDVSVNIDNLLDRGRYFVSQINAGNQLYPGQPFSAQLTVRYRFR